ncbi:MAG: hypothetical protein H2212_18720 [Ruminococcus sp.]|jgi:membrane protein CcdC involved in cytochrome C biogenesis|nr:hypothetical protein [Ruminococcus sp.]
MKKKKEVKKLLIRSIVFFNITIVVWIAACLQIDETNTYNTILAFLSIIPTAFYVVYAYKLNTLLEIDKYFTRL